MHRVLTVICKLNGHVRCRLQLAVIELIIKFDVLIEQNKNMIFTLYIEL